jgi:predicted RNA binding protein YcfA (HicA-like mRNA interferase family)
MRKKLTFASLERALVMTGFEPACENGGPRVFRHEATDTLVVLPAVPGDRRLDTTHLAAVSRTLAEKGVIERAAFEDLLEAV